MGPPSRAHGEARCKIGLRVLGLCVLLRSLLLRRREALHANRALQVHSRLALRLPGGTATANCFLRGLCLILGTGRCCLLRVASAHCCLLAKASPARPDTTRACTIMARARSPEPR